MWITPQVSDASYDLTGPTDAPVVVLIHGLGLCRELWDSHLAAFDGYRVLRYDLYGHGACAPFGEPVSLGVYADQLANLLDHLKIKSAHIIGFSIGGMINRRFALDYPRMVQSLVILNSPHDRGEDAQRNVEDRAVASRTQGSMATLDAAVQRWFTDGALAQGTGPGLVRAWRALTDPDSYADMAWVLAHGVRELIAPDPPITVPTLVMTCENDVGSTPQMSRDIAAEIEGASLEIIPDFKHLGLMEDPAAFLGPILTFLNAQRME